jgi:ribosome-interacting GTPase 1
VSALEELAGVRFPAVAVSAKRGQVLEQLAPFVFGALGIVRVYTKPPGHPPDRTRPFIVRRGNTVSDVARLVHEDVARSLKFARLWGSGAFDGQQVGPDHVTDLREEIVKTEKHEWCEALHLGKQILEGVLEQLSV